MSEIEKITSLEDLSIAVQEMINIAVGFDKKTDEELISPGSDLVT